MEARRSMAWLVLANSLCQPASSWFKFSATMGGRSGRSRPRGAVGDGGRRRGRFLAIPGDQAHARPAVHGGSAGQREADGRDQLDSLHLKPLGLGHLRFPPASTIKRLRYSRSRLATASPNHRVVGAPALHELDALGDELEREVGGTQRGVVEHDVVEPRASTGDPVLFSATLYERLASHVDLDILRTFRLARLTCLASGHECVGAVRLFEHTGREVKYVVCPSDCSLPRPPGMPSPPSH